MLMIRIQQCLTHIELQNSAVASADYISGGGNTNVCVLWV